VTTCLQCGAALSDWELREGEWLQTPACWCAGIPRNVSRTLGNLAYATLCDPILTRPIKIHDITRLVAPQYAGNPVNSINVALSQNKRFCWGGRALYGLARHGLVPGARSLAEAAYAVLLAAPGQLHIEEIDFVLKQLKYRFNTASLLPHLLGYTGNRWDLRFNVDSSDRVWVHSGRDKRHEFNRCIRVCPSHAGFDSWLDEVMAPKVKSALDDRTQRLTEASGTNSR